MPSVDLRAKLEARRAAREREQGDQPFAAQPQEAPWRDQKLKEITAAIQKRLRRDCPDLLTQASLTPEPQREILSRIQSYLAEDPALHLPGVPASLLARQVFDYVAGMGPLQTLIEDDRVSEIAVNRWDDVWVERDGHLVPAPEIRFRDDLHVYYVAQRVLAPLGIELSAASPLATGRLQGNIRVAASVPPVSPCCTLNVRKPALQDLSTEEYLRRGFASPEMLGLLQAAAAGRANILVAGPTGTGKSTLLRYLGRFFPREARILVLESTAELGLEQFHPHVLTFECRAGSGERAGVEMADLLVHALHRRPDYIIVGEVRGAEALQLLMAMATGHPGASTVHAESPDRLFDRLALAILQARLQISNVELLRYLAEAVDLVAYVERMADGSRRLTYLSEIEGYRDGNPVLRHLYRFETSRATTQKVEGNFVPNHPPSRRLTQKLARWGVVLEGMQGAVVAEPASTRQ